MENILNALLQILPINVDAVALSVATLLATALVLGIKAVFSFARKLAQKTPGTLDDEIVKKTEEKFKDKSRDI